MDETLEQAFHRLHHKGRNYWITSIIGAILISAGFAGTFGFGFLWLAWYLPNLSYKFRDFWQPIADQLGQTSAYIAGGFAIYTLLFYVFLRWWGPKHDETIPSEAEDVFANVYPLYRDLSIALSQESIDRLSLLKSVQKAEHNIHDWYAADKVMGEKWKEHGQILRQLGKEMRQRLTPAIASGDKESLTQVWNIVGKFLKSILQSTTDADNQKNLEQLLTEIQTLAGPVKQLPRLKN